MVHNKSYFLHAPPPPRSPLVGFIRPTIDWFSRYSHQPQSERRSVIQLDTGWNSFLLAPSSETPVQRTDPGIKMEKCLAVLAALLGVSLAVDFQCMSPYLLPEGLEETGGPNTGSYQFYVSTTTYEMDTKLNCE